MKITVDISLYPLAENFKDPINEFIDRLKKYSDIEIVTTAASTLVVGEHSKIFEILSKETEKTFSHGKHVFVMKIIGFERDIDKKYG